MAEPLDLASWPTVRGEARGLGFVLRHGGAGEAVPWLLVHSINAAASAAEMAPLAERLATRGPVVLLELPGFGDADRPLHAYGIEDFVAAISAAQTWCADRFGQAPVLCALSLSAEFAARAVLWGAPTPPAVVWIAPTGLDSRSLPRAGLSVAEAPPVPHRGSDRVFAWLHGRPLGRWAFRLLRRPRVIRYFLRRTFGRRAIDEPLFQAACRVARAPGAEHAPLAFLSGRLFAQDAPALYRALTIPQVIVHGQRGDFQDYRGIEALKQVAQAPVRDYALPTGALPQIEAPAAFAAAVFQGLGAALAPALAPPLHPS